MEKIESTCMANISYLYLYTHTHYYKLCFIWYTVFIIGMGEQMRNCGIYAHESKSAQLHKYNFFYDFFLYIFGVSWIYV